ncbi:MAG: GWxTD domain-containing protein [Gemmatimonadaceae bacterium]
MAPVAALVVGMAACASGSAGSGSPSNGSLQSYDPQRAAVAGAADQFAEIYDQMGLAASGPPLFFVGDVAYFATRSPDTTLVVVGLSLPNKGLVFKREESGTYSASYAVDLSLTRGDGLAAQARDSESVRVTSFKETSRTDESVIYKRSFRAAPGMYSLNYVVRDGNSQRGAGHTLSITVPRLSSSGLSTPEPVYEAKPRTRVDSVPNYLPAPRASYVFGVDDSASIYLESYNPSKPVVLQLRTPDGKVAWEGTRMLPTGSANIGSGLVTVPLVHSDVGVGTILATQAGSPDTMGTRIFVGFGPDLPVLSFKEMLGYLRFFRARSKLASLYSATPENRGARWSEFLRETDPNPNTPQNEALDAYFSRIRDANSQFVTDSPRGWLSDRGMVYVTLGAPTNSYEDYALMYPGDIATPGEVPTRVKVLVWQYDQYQAQIIFYDPNDIRQWRLTRQSMSQFQSLLARVTNR